MALSNTLQYLLQKNITKQVHNMAKDTLKIEQGARLEQIINRLDLTQVAAGQLIGLSQSYISQMIAGERTISKKILQFIAKNFPHISIEWLLTGDGEMEKPPNTQLANESTPIYGGGGVLENLIVQVREMDERLKALEKTKKE